MYVHVCIHVHMVICIHVFSPSIHVRMFDPHTRIRSHKRIHVHMSPNVQTHVRTDTHACMRVFKPSRQTHTDTTTSMCVSRERLSPTHIRTCISRAHTHLVFRVFSPRSSPRGSRRRCRAPTGRSRPRDTLVASPCRLRSRRGAPPPSRGACWACWACLAWACWAC